MADDDPVRVQHQGFANCRAVWSMTDFPIVGGLALVFMPIALFADFVLGLVRLGNRFTQS